MLLFYHVQLWIELRTRTHSQNTNSVFGLIRRYYNIVQCMQHAYLAWEYVLTRIYYDRGGYELLGWVLVGARVKPAARFVRAPHTG